MPDSYPHFLTCHPKWDRVYLCCSPAEALMRRPWWDLNTEWWENLHWRQKQRRKSSSDVASSFSFKNNQAQAIEYPTQFLVRQQYICNEHWWTYRFQHIAWLEQQTFIRHRQHQSWVGEDLITLTLGFDGSMNDASLVVVLVSSRLILSMSAECLLF